MSDRDKRRHRRKPTVLVCPLCGGVAFTRGLDTDDTEYPCLISIGGPGHWPADVNRGGEHWGKRTFWECADPHCGAAIMVSAQERTP